MPGRPRTPAPWHSHAVMPDLEHDARPAGSPLEDHRSSGGPSDCCSDTCQGFPIVGLKSTFQSGDFAALRLASGQRTSRCSATRVRQRRRGHGSSGVLLRLQAVVRNEQLVVAVVDPDGRTTPATASQWFSNSSDAPFGKNSSNNPGNACSPRHRHGNGFGLTDGIAVATKNCRNSAIDTVALNCQLPRPQLRRQQSDRRPGLVCRRRRPTEADPSSVIKIYILPVVNAFISRTRRANNRTFRSSTSRRSTSWPGQYNNQRRVDPARPGNDNDGLHRPADRRHRRVLHRVDSDGGTVDENRTATCVEGHLAVPGSLVR